MTSTDRVLDHPVATAATDALGDILRERRVVVCVGSGGVGKTTTAATLGLIAASRGQRTLVITIDPARRLAQALGLDGLSHGPQVIDESVARAAGMIPGAELSAMMLDLKAAWDDMLFRTAPNEETARRILDNRFYAALSRDLPGAHEFIACECLHHLTQSGRYDLVILDTPPTSNALDFLEAPARILSVLDSDGFRYFARDRSKSSGPLSFLDGAAQKVQGVLARFTGAEMLQELSEFVLLLRDLYEPLTTRTQALQVLLRSDDTRFLIVTSPEPATLDEATFFAQELRRRELKLAAIVVNRMSPAPVGALAALAHEGFDEALRRVTQDDGDADALGALLEQAAREEAARADADDAAVSRFVELFAAAPAVFVPRLPSSQDAGLGDVRRLGEIARWLVPARSEAGPRSAGNR